MKIPARTIKLTEELDSDYVNAQGEPYWFKVPRTWSEGYINRRARLEREHDAEILRKHPAGHPQAGELVHDDAERSVLNRQWNASNLDAVIAWNLDGIEDPDNPSRFAGQPLPLPREAANDDERIEIMAAMPEEVLRLIARSIYTASPKNIKVPEEVAGN